MVPSRYHPSGAVRWRFGLGVAAVSLLLMLDVALPAGATPLPATGAVPSVAAPCSALLSNSSLTAAVSEHYPNASLLPAAPTATSNAVSAWQTVCGSSAFQTAATQGANLSFSYTVQATDKNRTTNGTIVGSLFARFSLSWTGACPADGYPAGYPCAFTDGWAANLTTLAISGPTSTAASERLAQCDTPAQNQSDVYELGEFYIPPPSSDNASPPGGNTTATEPNETVADGEVAAIWGTVCASAAYYNVLVGHPTAQLSTSAWVGGGGGTTGNGSGGALSFEWSLGWDAACPANMTGAANATTCYFTESWTADLAQDNYVGPVAEVTPGYGIPGLGSGPPPASPGADGAVAAPIWAAPVFWVVVSGTSALLAIAAVLMRRARGPGQAR